MTINVILVITITFVGRDMFKDNKDRIATRHLPGPHFGAPPRPQ
jgi:hypothetical protein